MNNLEQMMVNKEAAIAKRWFEEVLETYPPETARIWKKEKDRFANPVGNTIHEGIVGLYRELSQGDSVDPGKVVPFLDKIVRIRAIQDFTASRAVEFVFFLKRLVREELKKENDENHVSSEALSVLDAKVDKVALLAFEIYVGCREQIYELRVNEVKNRTSRMLQRANLIVEDPTL